MIKQIKDNPFRTLGILTNASLREQIANETRISRYASIGRTVDFPLDLKGRLGEVARDQSNVSDATAKINLPDDKIRHALFWFCSVDSFDEIAIESLKQGDVERARSIWNRKETFSSLINLSVLAFINEDYDEAVAKATRMLHPESDFSFDDEEAGADYYTQFGRAICGETYEADETNLAHQYIDELLTSIDPKQLANIFQRSGVSADDDDYLIEKVVSEPLSKISGAIAASKLSNGSSPRSWLEAGIRLMNETKPLLIELEGMVDEDNVKYQIAVDALANQILQCGINYHNDSNDDDKIERALVLLKYALDIAVGKMAKERCQENYNILQKNLANLPPLAARKYDRAIDAQAAIFAKKAKNIDNAIAFIIACAPYLGSLKEVLGVSNACYLNNSTFVAREALNAIIDEVNKSQDSVSSLFLGYTYSYIEQQTRRNAIAAVVQKAVKATLLLDHLDLHPEFKTHYKKNRSTLFNIANSLDISTYYTMDLDMRSDNQRYAACRGIPSLEEYLKIFSFGNHAEEARTKLEQLLFEDIKTEEDCTQFKKSYPNTRFDIDGKTEKIKFHNCQNSQDYLRFKAAYPHSHYPVDKNIQNCRWSECKTIADYHEYARLYPRDHVRADAAIEGIVFGECKTVAGYQNYLRLYPNGAYAAKARNYIEDEAMWAVVSKQTEKKPYKEYLAKFPHGNHKQEAEKKAGACYVATMVYGGYDHPQVVALRGFRDDVLRRSRAGRQFISYYYKHSPAWVERHQNDAILNKTVKALLNIFLKLYNHEKK